MYENNNVCVCHCAVSDGITANPRSQNTHKTCTLKHTQTHTHTCLTDELVDPDSADQSDENKQKPTSGVHVYGKKISACSHHHLTLQLTTLHELQCGNAQTHTLARVNLGEPTSAATTFALRGLSLALA